MAHDPEADIVYITATYRKKGGPIYEHAAALREWGADLPWAWPTDALQHERKSGEQIKEMFLGHGLNMLTTLPRAAARPLPPLTAMSLWGGAGRVRQVAAHATPYSARAPEDGAKASRPPILITQRKLRSKARLGGRMGAQAG
jgi:hypothetical protein